MCDGDVCSTFAEMFAEREIGDNDNRTWRNWPDGRIKIKEIVAHTIMPEIECECGCGNMVDEGRRLIMYAALKEKCKTCKDHIHVWIPAEDILHRPALKAYIRNTRLKRIIDRDFE